ncbi:MAG: hypothetical protein HY560_01285 [Gemmatimonadetes bacterium]|nr:hypothetical protein [Gemmatimonadota bacterium]
MLNLIEVNAAVGAFDAETRVQRAFFKLLAERGDAPDCADPEAVFQAGRALTEGADRLLAALLRDGDE